MKGIKTYLHHLFIDGLSGMALGLFATLIVGTILEQIAALIAQIGAAWCQSLASGLVLMAGVAKALTGAGIGAGVAQKFKESPLVTVSAAVAGMVGAFASKLLAGAALSGSVLTLAGPGEPLGAFVAAYTAIELGHLVSGKTKVDILVTPIVGLVGQILTYQTMTAGGTAPAIVLLEIAVMHFIAPALLTLGIAESMRKLGWIRPGDLKLSL